MNFLVRSARRAAAALLTAAFLTAPAIIPASAQTASALSQTVEATAKTPGDTPAQREARKAVAKAFYDSAGMADRYADELKGIDLSKPVERISLPAGTQMYQYVRDGAKYLGNFFSPSPQAIPTCLGISGTKRTQVTATLPATVALASTAGPIVDTWTTKGVSVQTEGGCGQVVVDNAAKTKAVIVNK